MDQVRERIQADLRGLLDGEVRCDDVFVQMYASDASIYEIKPLGVVRPRRTADVVACVQYAAEHGIPIYARGAGSGVAGESLGPGLMLDFSYGMRRTIAVEGDTVRVQPGVNLRHLNSHLARHGRFYGPDPATRSITTMGSALAVDAAGAHWPRHGSARTHIVSMEVVLADGEVIKVGTHPVVDKVAERAHPRRQEIVRRLGELISREGKLISQHQPQTVVNHCGYHLHQVLRDGMLDLARVIVGSEGTLGLITEATVKTLPASEHRGVALLFFDRLDSAARAAMVVAREGFATCDLMDRRLLTIAREMDVRFELLIPVEAEAMLLVEEPGNDADEVDDKLRRIVARLVTEDRLAFDTRMTMETEERNLYWRLTRRVVTTLYTLKGNSRALPFVEDIAVAPEKMPEFLVQIQNVLKSHAVTASLFGHVGQGQLHLRPFLDLANPDHVRKMPALATDLYERVLRANGTINGEHALGLSRTWFTQKQCGPLYEVFREVKRIFDPQNILNPGKVVTDTPQPLTKNLRPIVAGGPPQETSGDDDDAEFVPSGPLAQLQLPWDVDQFAYAARNCNGCARCRTLGSEERMCPIFRFAPREEASPRAKANLVRAVLTGRLDPAELAGDELKAIVDLCVNCHQCRIECPAQVDIPKLALEAKAQYVASNGLRLYEWCMARVDRLSRFGSTFSALSNWAIRNRRMRWVIEKALGIAQGRKLPKFEHRSFLHQAHRKRLTKPPRRSGRKVLYFVDVYANWHDTQLANALIAVMQHNGVAVYVHPGQVPSGSSAISLGAADRAKRLASRNIDILADAVRQGFHIVATEPSAALCLTHEYLNLLDHVDARLVAENTSEACSYLWRMHQSGQLELDLKPVNATLGYHLPCHLNALEVGSPGENLLGLIPGVVVHRLEKGCSGMAGTFGLRRHNYRSSLRAGWGLISSLRNPRITAGTTECSACKMQMEQGTTKPTIHPLKILALAYGLMPELDPLLTTHGEELVVT